MIIFLMIIILIFFLDAKIVAKYSLKNTKHDYRAEIYLFYIKVYTLGMKSTEGEKEFSPKPFLKVIKENMRYIKISNLDINIKLGLIDILLTTYAVPFVSAVTSFIIKKLEDNLKNYSFEILPIYNELLIDININCIVKIKIAHIIYIIFRLMKEGAFKNGRTSNRRAYDYSNEQHKRYG